MNLNIHIQLSQTEENYIKTIFQIQEKEAGTVSTNSIAESTKTTAASVTDMIKRLAEKNLVVYKKYKGVHLSKQGQKIAVQLIRKNRLWKAFLVNTLKIDSDKISEIAEQLEHINSETLTKQLDEFLGSPKFDPLGNPIPNAEGIFTIRNQTSLVDINPGEGGYLVSIKTDNEILLKYLNNNDIRIKTHFKVLEKVSFDNSTVVVTNESNKINLSNEVCRNLFIRKESHSVI